MIYLKNFSFYVALVTNLFLLCFGTHVFDNDLEYVEPETGGVLRLKSKGKISRIVDLDILESVKRVLCRHDKILVALKDDKPDVDWKPGQLVVGSGKWRCSHNVLKPESQTIYARIASIVRPKQHVVELKTEQAGPLDMFDDASIMVHYEQGKMVPTRHRRYLSNPLRKVLNHVDWNATFTKNIPFNLADKRADEVVNLYKRTGNYVPAVDMDRKSTYSGKDFLFRCISCHGYSHISYHFELKVYKIDNKAVVQKYVMDMDINSHIQQNVSLYTEKEVTLTKSARLWTEEPVTIFQTPIFSIQNFPPVILTVNYSSQANIELTSTTKNATSYSGEFDVSGRTVISQRYDINTTGKNDVTVYNWTATSTNQNLDTNYNMNATFAFFQNMTISPAISWAQKDVDMKLGPPIHISARPRVNLVSTTDTVSRCGHSSVSVDSNITVAETDFTVDAFGIPIWNVKIMNKIARKFNVLKADLMHQCHADCHGLYETNERLSMEKACGEPAGPIIRGDDRFQRLHQLWGDFVLFSDTNNSSTCPFNTDKMTACSKRIVTSEMAASLTRLAKFVDAEWSDRKLLVDRGYDDSGQSANLTVFQEARAVEVSLSKSKTFEVEDDSKLLQRFSELAVCSRFNQVKRSDPSLSVCVEKVVQPKIHKRSLLSRKRRSGHVDHGDVAQTLADIGDAIDEVKSSLTDPPSLSLFGTFPSTKTMEQACGAFTGQTSQDDRDRFKRLVEYPHNDVHFSTEGQTDSWCGVETRQCKDCSAASVHIEDQWSWCGTRTMGMRMAIRLKRLAGLTEGQVMVVKALTMNVSDGSTNLYKEGRAVRIKLVPGSSHDMATLTSKAILAGFDSVRYTAPDYIEVCTKIQDGLQTNLVQFPGANLISVPLPLGEESEYDYPSELKHESRKPLLFDSTTSTNNIGERFKLSHFLSPGKRFVRLDPVLVDILELAYDELKGGLYIIPGSGYRPRSINMDNIDTRHSKEKLRYQMGQAVEVKPNTIVNSDSLFKLGAALVKAAKSVRLQRISIGIGCKPDRMYLEIRPMGEEDDRALEVWQSDVKDGDLYTRLKEIETMVTKGGTVVSAREDPVICSTPVLGAQYYYFNFDLDQEGLDKLKEVADDNENDSGRKYYGKKEKLLVSFKIEEELPDGVSGRDYRSQGMEYCWSDTDDFCAVSHESRYNISQVLQRRLTSAAGTGKLPRQDIMPEIEHCIIHACGGCPSAGTIWKQKVIACTKMILKYLTRASIPFQPLKDKVSVFNTENHESGVHSQACHDGRICVENTQIYSLLMPLITATFKRGTTDELLFGGADNPSPLLEIVEQELAWRAEGKVNVYVETAKDINAMRNVIKILMVLNKKVTDVVFHIDPDADEDDIMITLQRKIEQWSASTCPTWGRLVTTPYQIYNITPARKRRSLERSKDRNKMKFDMKNWEVEWALKS